MNNHQKLVVFDWDGTLMDSIDHIVSSIEHAAERMGLAPLPREAIKNIIGLGMIEAIHALYPGFNDPSFFKQFAQHYRDHFFQEDAPQQLFDGAREVLNELRQHNYLIAIATSKSRRGLDHILDKTGLASFIDASRCADETKSKPHPLMLMEILGQLKIAPNAAVMIGDTEYDMEMACNAKVAAIAVRYGVHNCQQLMAHEPIACADSIKDVPAILRNWNYTANGTQRI